MILDSIFTPSKDMTHALKSMEKQHVYLKSYMNNYFTTTFQSTYFSEYSRLLLTEKAVQLCLVKKPSKVELSDVWIFIIFSDQLSYITPASSCLCTFFDKN